MELPACVNDKTRWYCGLGAAGRAGVGGKGGGWRVGAGRGGGGGLGVRWGVGVVDTLLDKVRCCLQYTCTVPVSVGP